MNTAPRFAGAGTDFTRACADCTGCRVQHAARHDGREIGFGSADERPERPGCGKGPAFPTARRPPGAGQDGGRWQRAPVLQPWPQQGGAGGGAEEARPHGTCGTGKAGCRASGGSAGRRPAQRASPRRGWATAPGQCRPGGQAARRGRPPADAGGSRHAPARAGGAAPGRCAAPARRAGAPGAPAALRSRGSGPPRRGRPAPRRG